MSHLRGKRMLVTGGAGFLGQHLCAELLRHDPAELTYPRSDECDLLDRGQVRRMLLQSRPELVFHLAAVGERDSNAARTFYQNGVMTLELVEQARLLGVEKLVLVGSTSCYGRRSAAACTETALAEGVFSTTALGMSQWLGFHQAQLYAKEYELAAICLVLGSLYGPGQAISQFARSPIDSIIESVLHALESGGELVRVASSGQDAFDFLYVEDAARNIAKAAASYSDPLPLNLASGVEHTLLEAARHITREIGFRGHLRWEVDGSQRRRERVDIHRAEQLGIRSEVALEAGLRQTVQWHREQRGQTRGKAA